MANNILNTNMKSIRLVICVLNILFLAIAAVLIVLALQLQTTLIGLQSFIKEAYFNPATLICLLAGILISLTIFGFVTILWENPKLTNLYGGVLIILGIVEIAGSGAAFLISKSNFNGMKFDMENDFRLYEGNGSRNKIIWNALQQDMHCCGFHKPQDWAIQDLNDTLAINYRNVNVPYSCCVDWQTCESKTIYSTGCWTVVKRNLSCLAQILGFAILCLVTLQVNCVSLLAKYLRRNEDQFQYGNLKDRTVEITKLKMQQ